MPAWFSAEIPVLFSGVIAVLAIAATYVLCLHSVMLARKHGNRGQLGVSPDRKAETDRQLVELHAELDALRVHQPHGRSDIQTDTKRL